MPEINGAGENAGAPPDGMAMDYALPDNDDRSRVDPTDAVTPYLHHSDDVVRCSAARALAAIGDSRAAPALVEALLDEDPDLRSDAMSALIRCARPNDADAIRRSLEGDPDTEVKLAAIDALAAINDRGAIALLRLIARDRAEEQIDWEDTAGFADDWLDAQNAAIAALGRMQATEALDDLLAARTDEFGQDVDHVVFEAMAGMPGAGLNALVDAVDSETGRTRERILSALAKAQPEHLRAMADDLASAAEPGIRILAVPFLSPNSQEAARLALSDPDRTVRRTAASSYAGRNAALGLQLLSDPDETVRAAALAAMPLPADRQARDDLAANLMSWMQMADGPLAAKSAERLAEMDATDRTDPLSTLALDATRPLNARIAGIAPLGTTENPLAFETLSILLNDPIRQIRAAALSALADRTAAVSGEEGAKAVGLLVDTIGEAVVDPDGVRREEEPETGSAAASKVEDAPRLRISPSGEIVEADDETPAFPQSTLSAIGAWRPESGSAPKRTQPIEEAPADAPKKSGKRRVAVEGPQDPAADRSLIAMRVAASCPDTSIEAALSALLTKDNDAICDGALEALANRARDLSLTAATLQAVRTYVSDPEPRRRHFAVLTLSRGLSDAVEYLRPCLDDPDPAVRAVAVETVGGADPAAIVDRVGDASPVVRQAALTACLEAGTNPGDLLERLLQAQASDTIAKALLSTDRMLETVIVTLRTADRRGRDLVVLLEALAHHTAPLRAPSG